MRWVGGISALEYTYLYHIHVLLLYIYQTSEQTLCVSVYVGMCVRMAMLGVDCGNITGLKDYVYVFLLSWVEGC